MDGGAWWATVHGVEKSWTRLSNFTHSLVDYITKKMVKDTDKQPEEEVHRVRSGNILTTRASMLMNLGST